MHQPFYASGSALFVLVWDVALPQPPVGELCRWAVSIQACSPGAKVLLVGSHADQAESAAAAERSCTVVVQRLRAALDAQASNGMTALMVAAQIGDDAIVKRLIRRGANIRLRNESGLTATRILLKRGRRRTNSRGTTSASGPSGRRVAGRR